MYGAAFQDLDHLPDVEAFLTAAKGTLAGLSVHAYPMTSNCNVTAYVESKGVVAGVGAERQGC